VYITYLYTRRYNTVYKKCAVCRQ